MTSSEQQAFSERIATLAEAAGLSAELLWEPAETCPQGHAAPPSMKEIGSLCYVCIMDGFRADQPIGGRDYLEFQYSVSMNRSNIHWHPEWRIGKQAKDFTDPMILLAVVEAWRTQRPMRSWSVDSQVDYASPDTPTLPYATIGNGHCEYFERNGETPWEALALAFAEALEREKGVN